MIVIDDPKDRACWSIPIHGINWFGSPFAGEFGIPDAKCGDERRFGTLTELMSALGQKPTFGDTARDVRSWG